LDAAEVAVVADAQDAVTQRFQRALGPVDLAERLGLDGCAVRAPRGEARRRRLLGAGKGESAGQRPDLVLAQAGLEQGVHDAPLARRLETGPPVAEIVDVRARGHGVVAPAAREVEQPGVQLALAVVAA